LAFAPLLLLPLELLLLLLLLLVLVLPSSPFPASEPPPDPLSSPRLPLLEPDADPPSLPLELVLAEDVAPDEPVPLPDPDEPLPLEVPLEPMSVLLGELAHPAATAIQKSTTLYFIGSYLLGNGVNALVGCSLGRRAPSGAHDPKLGRIFHSSSAHEKNEPESRELSMRRGREVAAGGSLAR
jgi:hypothetical protein